MACAEALGIYQLKITLKGYKPPIWRRVLVSKDSSFEQLHFIICTCMKYSGDNVHYFMFDSMIVIGPPEYTVGKEKTFDDKVTKICDFLKSVKDKIEYRIEGAAAEHKVELEEIWDSNPREQYPMCIGGKRPCPPLGSDNLDWESNNFHYLQINLRQGVAELEKAKKVLHA